MQVCDTKYVAEATGGVSDVGSFGTSRPEGCHLHEDQAQDAPDRPVVEKPATSSDDNCIHVWRRRGERLNPALALQRHITPTDGVMLWDAIAYNTRSPVVLIRGTMTVQWYVHGILQPHVLPLMQRFPGAIFNKTILGLHGKGVI
ncbi:transposable element Tcb1 transposase [Trichonephila clavipes]|nr:transposable element Tcb1 transposase [Trichonephila clavipes]